MFELRIPVGSEEFLEDINKSSRQNHLRFITLDIEWIETERKLFISRIEYHDIVLTRFGDMHHDIVHQFAVRIDDTDTLALVDIIDVDHTRADVVDGEYVLESSFSGPLEILYAPASTGEQLCVMRFFAGNPPDKAVIIDANIAVATDAKTGATSGLATVCEWSQDDEEFTETTSQITVYNHSESTAHDADTFGVARWIDGHWWFFGDCDAMASR